MQSGSSAHTEYILIASVTLVKQHTAVADGALLLTLQMTGGKMCIEAKHLSTPECQVSKEHTTKRPNLCAFHLHNNNIKTTYISVWP